MRPPFYNGALSEARDDPSDRDAPDQQHQYTPAPTVAPFPAGNARGPQGLYLQARATDHTAVQLSQWSDGEPFDLPADAAE